MLEEFDMEEALAELDVHFGPEVEEEGNIDNSEEVVEDFQELTATDEEPSEPKSDTIKAPSASDFPSSWKKGLENDWAALPESIRNEVLRREQDIFAGIERYKQGDANWKRVEAGFAPMQAIFQQYGIDPIEHLPNLAQAHLTLSFGTPQQKSQLMQQLIHDYHIDLSGIAENIPYQDPDVLAVQSHIQALESRLQAKERAEQSAKLSQLTQEIETFAADPKNKYFNEVANDMATLAKSGIAGTISEVYEKAIYFNPIVRAKIEQEKLEAAIAERSKAAAEEASKAKEKSSANLRTRNHSGSRTTPVGSWDDTLNAAYEKAVSR